MNVWTSSNFLFWSLICCLFSWLAIGIQITCTSNINMNSSELTNLNPDQFQISQLQIVETIGSNPSRCKLSFRVKKIEQEFASRGIWFLLALGRTRESGMWHGLLLTDLLTSEIDMPFQETQATLFRKWSWTIMLLVARLYTCTILSLLRSFAISRHKRICQNSVMVLVNEYRFINEALWEGAGGCML